MLLVRVKTKKNITLFREEFVDAHRTSVGPLSDVRQTSDVDDNDDNDYDDDDDDDFDATTTTMTTTTTTTTMTTTM